MVVAAETFIRKGSGLSPNMRRHLLDVTRIISATAVKPDFQLYDARELTDQFIVLEFTVGEAGVTEYCHELRPTLTDDQSKRLLTALRNNSEGTIGIRTRRDMGSDNLFSKSIFDIVRSGLDMESFEPTIFEHPQDSGTIAK
jgi:hypothetical protein